jgi:peptidoglycan/LPS O-acetylase OafA/YrhL
VYSAFSFIISALLIQSWLPFPLGAWISPGWSVSAELGAYAALPLLLFAVRRVRRPAVAMALAFLSLAGFVALLLAVGVHDVDVTVRGGLVRLAFEFTAGALVYQAWRRGAVAPSWLCNVAALAILSAVLTPVPAATFVALPGFAIVLLASAQGTSWIGRVFATRAMLFAGRVSYSLYLVHWPVLVVWQHFAGPPAATPAWIASVVVVLLVTPALAIACHYMVEAPSHRWARVAARDRATATALA